MGNQFGYFLKNFQLFYDTQGIEIGFGKNPDKKVFILKNCEDLLWNEKQDIHAEDIIWKTWDQVNIPFLFENDGEKDILTFDGETVVVNYDIVSSAFYFLSGWNEYVSSFKDEFGRVKYESSMIRELGISDRPVVNYYFDILREAIKLAYKKDIGKNVWGENIFAVSLTHDIDKCRSGWLEGSFSELKKGHFFSIPKLVLKRFLSKDDWFNFEKIVNLENPSGAKSSFYFLPQKGKTGKWENADYDVRSKSIQKTITFLKKNGNDVGVHGSFGAHTHPEILKNNMKRIHAGPIIGNRFHFLMFDAEKTVDVLEKCDIKYDTTLCFAEKTGFRRGTCYPFYLYNFKKNEISSVLEIPLVVMDGSLSNKKYMGVKKEETLPKIHQLIDEVKKFGGVFTLLWHNNYFSDYKYTGWKEIYLKTLDYCRKHDGLLTNGKAVYEKVVG